jgi:integrase
MHYRAGDNPARWDGHLEHSLPARSSLKPVKHHPALPYSEIGDFLPELRAERGTAADALLATILTCVRTTEIRKAEWSEIDFDKRIWSIPPERMKGKKNKERRHNVPLSSQALALFRALHMARQSDGLIFPGGKPGKPLSENAMLALLERMGRTDITVHGFRSTFRDWAAECTNFPREIAEAALAHVNDDKTEAAYQRGEFLEKRRKLMQAWADYCHAPTRARSGEVLSISSSRASARRHGR